MARTPLAAFFNIPTITHYGDQIGVFLSTTSPRNTE
jgi:hypothetical protein